MVCYQIRVTGKVQGVFYRASAKMEAERLGVKGWVQNMPDGSVLIEALGSKDKVLDLIAWCKKGPQFANVDKVSHQEVEASNYYSFDIKH